MWAGARGGAAGTARGEGPAGGGAEGSPRSASAAARELAAVLRGWDAGGREARCRMLERFTERHQAAGARLEFTYGNGASLLLTRVVAWMRLSYLQSGATRLQLETLRVFLRSSNGSRYLVEFLEAGGLLTLLQILNAQHRTVDEAVKHAAMTVLECVLGAGKVYREMVCKHRGVEALLGVLVEASGSESQHLACELVLLLGTGSAQYTVYVLEKLVNVLPCGNPGAQHNAALATKKLLGAVARRETPQLEVLLQRVARGAAAMLLSPESHVQYQSAELIKDMCQYEGAEALVVDALADLLVPREMFLPPAGLVDVDGSGGAFGAQEKAAQTIGLLAPQLCAQGEDLHAQVTGPKIVGNLIAALLNPFHHGAKRQASSSLLVLIQQSERTGATIRGLGFGDFLDHFSERPNVLYEPLVAPYLEQVIELGKVRAGFPSTFAPSLWRGTSPQYSESDGEISSSENEAVGAVAGRGEPHAAPSDLLPSSE